jgi:hypothetical protein
MFACSPPNTFSAAALVLGLALVPSGASAEEQRHCPVSTPENSHIVCGTGCDPDADKARLENLSKDIQKTKSAVCLLALVDSKDHGYSKKLAIKRVLWVRDTLIEHGVRSDTIAVEFRPLQPDADKAALHRVDIILGR